MAKRPSYDYRAWTPGELKQLRALAKARTPTKVIARKLKRTLFAVYSKMKREGVRSLRGCGCRPPASGVRISPASGGWRHTGRRENHGCVLPRPRGETRSVVFPFWHDLAGGCGAGYAGVHLGKELMRWQKKMIPLATFILPAEAAVGVSALALHRFLTLSQSFRT